MVLEDFFDIVTLTVIVGYGMTETSPVIANRWVVVVVVVVVVVEAVHVKLCSPRNVLNRTGWVFVSG